MDGVRGEAVRDEALPYGVDTIVLRIEWPAAAAARGYNGRMWQMRPLRGWTGGQALGGEPAAEAGLDGSHAGGGAAIPIADRVPAASNGSGGTQPALDAGADGGTAPNTAPLPPLDPNRPFIVDRRYDDALRRVRTTPVLSVVSAIAWHLRIGGPWRALPSDRGTAELHWIVTQHEWSTLMV